MANDGDLFLEHTGDAQVRRLASTGSVVGPNILNWDRYPEF